MHRRRLSEGDLANQPNQAEDAQAVAQINPQYEQTIAALTQQNTDLNEKLTVERTLNRTNIENIITSNEEKIREAKAETFDAKGLLSRANLRNHELSKKLKEAEKKISQLEAGILSEIKERSKTQRSNRLKKAGLFFLKILTGIVLGVTLGFTATYFLFSSKVVADAVPPFFKYMVATWDKTGLFIGSGLACSLAASAALYLVVKGVVALLPAKLKKKNQDNLDNNDNYSKNERQNKKGNDEAPKPNRGNTHSKLRSSLSLNLGNILKRSNSTPISTARVGQGEEAGIILRTRAELSDSDTSITDVDSDRESNRDSNDEDSDDKKTNSEASDNSDSSDESHSKKNVAVVPMTSNANSIYAPLPKLDDSGEGGDALKASGNSTGNPSNDSNVGTDDGKDKFTDVSLATPRTPK